MEQLVLLSATEQEQLTHHEQTIERGLKTFVEVGTALLAIRDARLYRAEHATFEDYCLERWNIKRQRAYELMSTAAVVNSLSEISDKLPSRESHAAALIEVPEIDRPLVWQRSVDTAPNGKVTAAHVEAVAQEYRTLATQEPPLPFVPPLSDVQRLNLSYNNEWYTPSPYIEAARKVLGSIDLDPASNPIANEVVRASTYFTKECDGLSQEWYGRIWLNPPYGFAEGNESHQARWSRRLIEEYSAGKVSAAILLVNAVPGNKWFAPLWDYPICFPDHRIRFYDENGELGQPTHSNALVYLGPDVIHFASVFSQFGVVATRYDFKEARRVA